MATVTKLKSEPKQANKSESAFKVHFTLERETKGALRYMQVSGAGATTPFTIAEGAQIGTLYIRKSAFGDATPKTLVIDVSISE